MIRQLFDVVHQMLSDQQPKLFLLELLLPDTGYLPLSSASAVDQRSTEKNDNQLSVSSKQEQLDEVL